MGSDLKHHGLLTSLNRFRTALADRSIATSIEEMTMVVGVRMWESKMFTKDQIVAWENKTPVQQTWQNLQDYFTEKWLEQRQYSQATAKQSRFKDAALTTQELAAAEEEGKTTAMMFALLQEQHKAQLEVMMAADKQAMDAMLERMNVLIAGQGKAADKPMAMVSNSNTGTASNIMNRWKKSMHELQKACFPQTSNLLRARVQRKQALTRMEIKHSRLCNSLTGTKDVK